MSNSCPNAQFLIIQQHVHQSCLVTSWVDPVCAIVACCVKFREINVYMNINYNFLTTMYERECIQYLRLTELVRSPTIKMFQVEIVNNIFCQKYVHLREIFSYIVVG